MDAKVEKYAKFICWAIPIIFVLACFAIVIFANVKHLM